MVDSIDSEFGGLAKNFSTQYNLALKNENTSDLLFFESSSELSEAEIKFLALSKEKKNSVKIIDKILSEKMTLQNYEEIFCLNKYIAVCGTINPENAVRNIRYKDTNGMIVAVVQIDNVNKKIRVQYLGDVLPKQECFTPLHIGLKLENLAKYNSWMTEDGGVNQFNGNHEFRFKDKKGNIMSAIITRPDGTFDTIAEYEYNSEGYRTQLLLTNHNGQSRTVYDGSASVNQLTRIDIDTDGIIVEITKILS